MNRAFLLVLLLVAPGFSQTLRRHSLTVDNPCPTTGAQFGNSSCVLDMDGTGGLELAAGAWGQGRVYLFEDVTMQGAGPHRVLTAEGIGSCASAETDDRFGYDVGYGNLDADPFLELIVGAPSTTVGPVLLAGAVYLFLHPDDNDPVVLRELDPGPNFFGESVTCGDFNGDGVGDVAVAAPRTTVAGHAVAGAVHVLYGPFDSFPASDVLENPQPILYGNFGQHLTVGDINQDGIDDLVVSAIGNSNQAGLPVAGQVYVYPGPIDPQNRLLIEDPVPDANDLPAPRFGMHVHARADWLLVGANRKDWVGVHDAGMGFSTRGVGAPVSLHPYPTPDPSDYMGFRCVVADVVGDAALDLTFVIMGDEKQLVTWDGNDPLGQPYLRQSLPLSKDHFGNGLEYGQVTPGGKEELVVGDGTYDAPNMTPKNNDAGRVVIYAYH